MKTIAEHAADVLNDPSFHTPTWKLNVGHLDTLHEIYNRYTAEHDLPLNNNRHPHAVRRAVTSALANTKSGRDRFRITGTINYPGIINAPCNVFELKEPYRTYAPSTEQES